MKNGDLMGLDGDLSELLPSGKRLHNYGKSPCSTGKSTIFYGHFQSQTVGLPEGTSAMDPVHGFVDVCWIGFRCWPGRIWQFG